MFVIDTARSSEINQLDDGVFLVFVMNVLRLDISMNDVVLVKIVDSGEQLSDHVCCLNLIEVMIGCHTFEQSSTMTHLVDEVDLLIVLVHLDDLADVGMIQLFQKFDLFEKLTALAKLQVFLADDLDGSCDT